MILIISSTSSNHYQSVELTDKVTGLEAAIRDCQVDRAMRDQFFTTRRADFERKMWLDASLWVYLALRFSAQSQ
jgi:hypothetical protein